MIVVTLISSYFGGCLFYIFAENGNSDEDKYNNNTFITITSDKRTIPLKNQSQATRAITMSYFMLTTMTAIGYGDLTPISDYEKIVGIFLFLVGHVFVIYVLSTFRQILDDIEKISAFNMKRKSMEADEIAL